MFELTAFLSYLKDIIEKMFFFMLIILITVFLKRILVNLFERSVNHSSRIIKIDHTHYRFLRHIISGLIYLIGISFAIYTIPQLKAFAVSLLAGAGIFAIVIGFASQQAFSNIISGIFIAVFKPFRVGDRIKISADVNGVVEDVTLRHTIIRNFKNKRLVIPNSKISEQTIENSNIGDDKICKWIDFSISYDSDVDKAMEIIREEAEKHPKILDNRTEEAKKDKEHIVGVKLVGFGDSSVNLRAFAWASNPSDAWSMGCDLNKSIKGRFDKEGIEIPYPYRTIVYKKDKKDISKEK